MLKNRTAADQTATRTKNQKDCIKPFGGFTDLRSLTIHATYMKPVQIWNVISVRSRELRPLCRHQQIGLTTKKGGNLQDINSFRRLSALLRGMDVGQ
ncbi:hypothetical protein AU467_31660 [Mesorhizobium loti]|uniref:Uncharacterized protein n=1 Tax=Rhizobium loti TaxID=381 RepID=A0A101KNH2_RHILI|nr:hypothetical protein AU467_31660 [Mesorhizobium loti]